MKYACNAFLAAKVSFVNAIALLCVGGRSGRVDVIRGMSYDRRIGADHLSPGPGWGGSCFPKDTNALIRIAEDHGYDFALLKEVVASNERQFDWVADQVEAVAGGSLQGSPVAVWGLTFKAGTDDLRDSPALAVFRRLHDRGASLKAFDPTMPDPSERPPSSGSTWSCAEILIRLARGRATGHPDRVARVLRTGPRQGGLRHGKPGDRRHPQPPRP